MRAKLNVIVLTFGALLAALPSTAQTPPNRRPGLWEVRQGPAAAGAYAIRLCMDEAEAKGDFRGLRAGESKDSCDYQRLSYSASEVRYRTVCKGGRDTLTMEGRAYDITPESFKVDTTMTGLGAAGQKMHTEARWIAADCKGAR